jgi:hypothetical protein
MWEDVIMVPGQHRQKSLEDPISVEKNLGMVVCTCHPCYSRKPESKRIAVQAGLGIK